jgi:hypothetical protein
MLHLREIVSKILKRVERCNPENRTKCRTRITGFKDLDPILEYVNPSCFTLGNCEKDSKNEGKCGILKTRLNAGLGL